MLFLEPLALTVSNTSRCSWIVDAAADLLGCSSFGWSNSKTYISKSETLMLNWMHEMMLPVEKTQWFHPPAASRPSRRQQSCFFNFLCRLCHPSHTHDCYWLFSDYVCEVLPTYTCRSTEQLQMNSGGVVLLKRALFCNSNLCLIVWGMDWTWLNPNIHHCLQVSLECLQLPTSLKLLICR